MPRDAIDCAAEGLVRQGLGWEDIVVELGISERDARMYVFGKDHARRWFRRIREMRRKAS